MAVVLEYRKNGTKEKRLEGSRRNLLWVLNRMSRRGREFLRPAEKIMKIGLIDFSNHFDCFGHLGGNFCQTV